MESILFFPFLMYAPSTATLRKPAKRFFFFLSCENVLQIVKYRRTTVTRTLKGNEKQFELGGNSSYLGNVSEIFIKCRGNFFLRQCPMLQLLLLHPCLLFTKSLISIASREGNDSESEPDSESSFRYLFQPRETSQSLRFYSNTQANRLFYSTSA